MKAVLQSTNSQSIDFFRRPNTFVKMTDRKAVIKNADMSEEMQQDAVDCATQALEKYNIEKDIAAYIKKVSLRTGSFPFLLIISKSVGRNF